MEMFKSLKPHISWFYLFSFSFIATSFLNENFVQKSTSFELQLSSSEGQFDHQAFQFESSKNPRTSSGISLNLNSRANNQIQKEAIEQNLKRKVVIPDLNEPCIDEISSTSSDLCQREGIRPNDETNTPLPEVTTPEDRVNTETYNLLLQTKKDSKKQSNHDPDSLQEKRMKTSTGRRSQVVVTQNSQPLGNAASIANVKVRKNLIWNVLQGQSRLALGKKFGMFEEIKTYFEEMKESSVFNFSNQSKQTYYKKQVEIALERIKIELVFGVLGIVNMSYRGAGSLKLIALLLDDAWHFLKDYLNKEILDVNHEQILKSILNNKRPDRHFLKPGNLMIHCLCLSKQSFISQDLFFEVLRVWTKSSIYKHLMSRIPLDFESLSIYCEKLYQETGQGSLGPQIIQSRKNTHSKLLDTSSAPSNDPDLGIQTCSSRKFSSFIKRSGKKIIDEEKIQAITQFFTDLNKVMKESYQTKSKFINQSTNSSIDQVYLSWTMIDCAMKTAQHSITPSFLGLLGLMHSGMSTPQTWDDIFESGWKFLKSYFSTWHRYVLEMNHPILLDTTKNEKVEIEWYDVKETIHYLHKLVSNNVCPQRPIWYLVDLWYESIKSDGNTISTNLNVLSPHREMMKYKCIQLDDQ